MSTSDFKRLVTEGIPSELPAVRLYDKNLNHAPKRKDILNDDEKHLAIKNALDCCYFIAIISFNKSLKGTAVVMLINKAIQLYNWWDIMRKISKCFKSYPAKDCYN